MRKKMRAYLNPLFLPDSLSSISARACSSEEDCVLARARFFGTNKVFRFGGESLTKGVEHLFSLCKDCPVYDGHTIGEVFELIRQSKVDTAKCRKGMKDEVSKRLDQIGYWDYVPIP